MASVDVRDMNGKKVGSRELPGELFDAAINVALMHQVVVAGLAAARSGTHSTKTRAEVSGGGRKPWRQKGTGRARHGSNRSPIWMGGGVAHGPKPQNHAMRVNKKMKQAALRSALTDSAQSDKLVLVDELAFDEPKTKVALSLLDTLELAGRVLVVLPWPDRTIELSFRNLPHIKVTYAGSLSVYDLLYADRVLFTRGALEALEGNEPGGRTDTQPDSAAGDEAAPDEPSGEEES